jgi:hypothetical protein
MTDSLSRRFVTVSAPNVLAAIGEILRRAFRKPAPAEQFEKLVARLDR